MSILVNEVFGCQHFQEEGEGAAVVIFHDPAPPPFIMSRALTKLRTL